MASVGDIKAGRAYVEIGAEDSQLVKTLASDARQLQKWGGAIRGLGLQLAGAGAAVLGPLAVAGASFASHGEELERSSKKTGLSVEATSTLGYAAEQTGTDHEALEVGIAKMSKTLTQAAGGSKTANAALEQLGLSVQDLNNLSQEDRLKKLADGITGIQDPAARTAAAMGVFGKGGAALLPLLTQGSAGIAAMQDRARALGLQWSGEEAEAGAKFSHVLKDLWAVLQHGVDVVGSAVAPVLTKLAQYITAAAVAATRWVREHKTLIATAAAVAAGVVAVGAALVGIGTAVSVVGIALGTVASGFGLLLSLVGAIVSPVGLVVAALAVGTVAFFKFSQTGAAVGNAIVGAFRQVYESIKFVFENTSSLSEAWAAAQTEAGTFILQAWASIKGFLLNLWAGLKDTALNLWDELGAGIADSAYAASDAFLKIWARTMHAWNGIVNATARAIQDTFFETDKAALNKDLGRIDRDEKGGKLTHEQAEKQRQTAHDTFDSYEDKQYDARRKQNDDELNQKLAGIDKEAAARKGYLNDLRGKQRSATDKSTADEIAANDKQTAAAIKSAQDARAAFEAEQKKKHAASGEASLADQFRKISGIGAAAGDESAFFDEGDGTDPDLGNDLLGSVKHAASFKTQGATNLASQGLATQIFANAGGEKKKPEEETAKNTREMKNSLKQIAGKRGPSFT